MNQRLRNSKPGTSKENVIHRIKHDSRGEFIGQEVVSQGGHDTGENHADAVKEEANDYSLDHVNKIAATIRHNEGKRKRRAQQRERERERERARLIETRQTAPSFTTLPYIPDP